ncbi:MAG: hypothetical protein J6Q22_12360 [Prevotella sp.]|nr:hypothetical protein [Prevotella sp.]
MRHIHYYIIIAFACAIFTGCMDNDWDIPGTDGSEFGNQAITETNLMTIAQLKQKFASVIYNGSYEKFTVPTQIKGVVTGNDIEGNIYNQIAIEDGTGSIIICVAQGGIFGQLQVGREIIVELQDLYIGSYGQQPEIGTPYTNKNGRTYVSRMSRTLWQSHYKMLGMKSVSSTEFDKTMLGNADYMKENCGRLMTIKGVKFQGGGKKVFAADKEKDAANSVNRSLIGISSNQLVVRTSTFADFANKTLPQGEVDITGIFTRYNNTWQVLIREESDIAEK